jgi:hypothetical protein
MRPARRRSCPEELATSRPDQAGLPVSNAARIAETPKIRGKYSFSVGLLMYPGTTTKAKLARRPAGIVREVTTANTAIRVRESKGWKLSAVTLPVSCDESAPLTPARKAEKQKTITRVTLMFAP